MPGVMLVRQRVADVARWQEVFGDPTLDAIRREHGLVVTDTCTALDEPAGHRDAVTEASYAWLATTLNREVRIG